MTRWSVLAIALLWACDVATSSAGSDPAPNQRPSETTDAGPPPVGSAPPAAPREPEEMQPPFDSSAVDGWFDHMRADAGAPGMSVALVKGGRVRWAKGYGIADRELGTPATEHTVFALASISKTVVGVALMQLLSDPSRGLSLDDDIGAHLPFAVRNPRYPSVPITFRMVLTHTTSILDLDASLEVSPGDSTAPLATYLAQQVASPDGWLPDAPGTKYEYSNAALTLAALLVERISGMDFETYCQQRVFEPIRMSESSWLASHFDPSHLAMPYQLEGTTFVSQGHYSWKTWPAGHLHTSAVQLGRFLAMFARGGELFGRRLLAVDTVKEMQAPQIPTIDDSQGLVWFGKSIGGRFVLGHSGAFLGISTEMWLDLETGAGFVLLTNGSAYYNAYVIAHTGEAADPAQGAAMDELQNKLFTLAQSLP